MSKNGAPSLSNNNKDEIDNNSWRSQETTKTIIVNKTTKTKADNNNTKLSPSPSQLDNNSGGTTKSRIIDNNVMETTTVDDNYKDENWQINTMDNQVQTIDTQRFK